MQSTTAVKVETMEIGRTKQTALHSSQHEEAGIIESWAVILELAAKTIKFSLSVDECRERRTISWLNNPPKTQLTEKYVPLYLGFRRLKDVEIMVKDEKILSYDSYFLDMDEIIFANDEFSKMGNSSRSEAMNQKRVTPDGVEIMTRSVGGNIYHISGHVYQFNNTLNQNQFIPMTNVLIKKMDECSPDIRNVPPKFCPFLALNRNYIEGFSILFRGSKGVR